MEKLDCVITQNIDSLHLKAGNSPSRVLEVHGHARTVHCLGCMETFSMEEIIQKNKGIEDIPVCGRCGGILKPDVVFFGEALPEDVFQQAIYHSIHSDLFIVVGSSLVVHPASMLPQFANDGGARMVIINHAPTPYDAMADIVVHASAGESMACVIEGLRHFFPSAETKGG
jgi:NAD-dependent deacetylase